MSHCQHCGHEVSNDAQKCPYCGIPLPPNHAIQKQKTFVRWFIALVIFCVVMMLWLPPDWSAFVNK